MEAVIDLIIGLILSGLGVWLIVRFKLKTNDEEDESLLDRYEELLREHSDRSKNNEESPEDSSSDNK